MKQQQALQLHDAASFCREFGMTFADLEFDERSQAVEVFFLQALSMSASHCGAAALLLEQGFDGEAVSVLRSVQELLFDLYWILEASDRPAQLERVYRLEADPYAHWARELRLIERKLSPELARRFRGPLDEIAADCPFLTEQGPDGTTTFKHAPTFADRMGRNREKYYHVYCYSSLFSHPTPTVKKLYLKTKDPDHLATDAFDESIIQFVAYSLLFAQLIMGFVNQTLRSFAPATQGKREELYAKMIQLVNTANRGYFSSPAGRDPKAHRPA
jgi:hypothetical protein